MLRMCKKYTAQVSARGKTTESCGMRIVYQQRTQNKEKNNKKITYDRICVTVCGITAIIKAYQK
jgi:hypothetical protein